MAELAISIAGIALAWKGILDFGELVSKIMDDDARHREVLAMKLEVSQHMLKDWGDDWGITQPDGHFHDFEDSRKELIMRIIFRLRDSRQHAMKRLKEHYGLLADEPDLDLGKRRSRFVDKIKGVAKRGKDKGLWLVHDHALVTALVNETVELHECLNCLTSVSTRFLVTKMDHLRTAQTLERGLAQLEKTIRERRIQTNITNQCQPFPQPEPDEDIDVQTLIGYATKSITSSWQMDHVQKHIDQAFHHHCDTRIPETISLWWNDPTPNMLVLEVADGAGNLSSTYACALMYYLATCDKLIHIFDPESTKPPNEQLVEMLRSLIQSLVSFRGEEPLASPFPASIVETENQSMDAEATRRLIGFFHELLRDILTSSDLQIVLLLDGIELFSYSDDSSLQLLIQLFMSELQTICDSMNEKQSLIKILVGHRGHANNLYDHLGVSGVADLVYDSGSSTNLTQALGSTLQGPVIGGTGSFL